MGRKRSELPPEGILAQLPSVEELEEKAAGLRAELGRIESLIDCLGSMAERPKSGRLVVPPEPLAEDMI